MNYLELLKRSYEYWQDVTDDLTKYEFLSNYIFDFTTYDEDLDKILVKKALESCNAISDRTSIVYIAKEDNYLWFITMLNMPFFKGKIEWGTSIRTAWWDSEIEVSADSFQFELKDGEESPSKLILTEKEWVKFIQAMNEFVTKEPNQ